MVYDGERVIEITSDANAWKVGGWYKGLVGTQLNAMMYSIMADEYTVSYNGNFEILPGKDCKIVKDTSVEKR